MKMKPSALCLLIVVEFCTHARAKEQITCTRSGPLCKDCRTLGYCSDQGNGKIEFDNFKEEKCGHGFVCDEWTKQCTRNGTCRFKEFNCSSKTDILVPSPYSCRGYYSCATQRMHLCEQGEYYDWDMYVCRPSEGIKHCERYPILCSEHGEIKNIGDFQYKCVLEKEHNIRMLYPKLIKARRHSISLQFSCQAEGYFEDPEDCTMFYKCMQSSSGFQIQHLSCRKGSHFDKLNQTCVLGECQTSTTATASTPSAAPTTTSTAPTTSATTLSSPATTTTSPTPAPFVCKSEGVFPDPLNCTMYYRCTESDGGLETAHVPCRAGSHFDETMKRCVPGECTVTTTSQTSPATSPTTSLTTKTTTMTPTTTPTTTAKPTPTPSPFACVEEGLFEDPENCTMFYKCIRNGNSFDQEHSECRKGSHFDPLAKKCIEGECQTTVSSITSSTLTTSIATDGTSPVTATQTQNTSPSFSCEEEGNFPDPENCMMFYKCVKNGNQFNESHISCRPGSHFDPVKKVCVLGECQTSTTATASTPSAAPTTTSTAPTTSATTLSSPATTTTSPTPAPFVCKSEGVFPDPLNCTMYYRCTESDGGLETAHVPCRAGSHFDETMKRCVPGECTVTTTSQTSPATSPTTSLTTKTTTMTPTTTPTTTAKPTPTPSPFACVEEGLFEDPENCTMFYRCIKNGNSLEQEHSECRKGSHFDPSKKLCVLGEC